MKRVFSLLAILVMVSTFFFGCESEANESDENTKDEEESIEVTQEETKKTEEKLETEKTKEKEIHFKLLIFNYKKLLTY